MTVHNYLQLKGDNYITTHSPEHKTKFKSVRFFKLSCMVSEIEAICLFLPLRSNRAMTYLEKLKFLNFEMF